MGRCLVGFAAEMAPVCSFCMDSSQKQLTLATYCTDQMQKPSLIMDLNHIFAFLSKAIIQSRRLHALRIEYLSAKQPSLQTNDPR